MCICARACTRVLAHAYLCVNMRVRVLPYACMHAWVCVCAYAFACVLRFVHAGVYVCVCVHVPCV